MAASARKVSSFGCGTVPPTARSVISLVQLIADDDGGRGARRPFRWRPGHAAPESRTWTVVLTVDCVLCEYTVSVSVVSAGDPAILMIEPEPRMARDFAVRPEALTRLESLIGDCATGAPVVLPVRIVDG